MKMYFTNITATPRLPGNDWGKWSGTDWELTETFYGTIAGHFNIEIKPGFITDFGSIPAIYRPRIERMGKGIAAFLVHDALYAIEYKSRKYCDDIMLEIMKDHEISWSRRNACYLGVRSGGWYLWPHTPESIELMKKYVIITEAK
jgi:hypothetical protein